MWFGKFKISCPWCKRKIKCYRNVNGEKTVKHCGKIFKFNSVGLVYGFLDLRNNEYCKINLRVES